MRIVLLMTGDFTPCWKWLAPASCLAIHKWLILGSRLASVTLADAASLHANSRIFTQIRALPSLHLDHLPASRYLTWQ